VSIELLALNCLDMQLLLANNNDHTYFTWARDQGQPNADAVNEDDVLVIVVNGLTRLGSYCPGMMPLDFPVVAASRPPGVVSNRPLAVNHKTGPRPSHFSEGALDQGDCGGVDLYNEH
jgi:hypothetical protein